MSVRALDESRCRGSQEMKETLHPNNEDAASPSFIARFPSMASAEQRIAEAAWERLVQRWPALHSDASIKSRVIRETREFVTSIATTGSKLPSHLAALVSRRDWQAALDFACSKAHPSWRPWHAISVCIELLLTTPDLEVWPRLLAITLGHADNPAPERHRLCAVLEFLRALDLRVYESDASRAAFLELPERVEIFRGTAAAEHESAQYGLCWSLDHSIAALFAQFQPYRFQSATDCPIVLHARVNRDDIAAVFFDMGHREVMVSPEKLQTVRAESVPGRIATCIDELTIEQLRAWSGSKTSSMSAVLEKYIQERESLARGRYAGAMG